MKKYIFLSLFLCFFMGTIAIGQAQPVTIYKESLVAPKGHREHIPLFTATKGDIIHVNVVVNEKRKTISLAINQHPGCLEIARYDKLNNLAHEFVVPADGVYEINYVGAKAEFDIEVTRTPGPGSPANFSREFTFVCQPDTLHHSEFYDHAVGHNISILPKVESVQTKELTMSEVVMDASFALEPGMTDFLNIDIPGTRTDKYKKQELLSWSITLTVGDEVYRALAGKVTDGLTAGFGKVLGAMASRGGGSGGKSQKDASDYMNSYEFVDDIGKEKSKFENATEVLELSGEGITVLGEGTAHEGETAVAGKAVESIAYVVESGGIKGAAVDFASNKVQDMVGIELPSISGVAGNVAGAITPKVKDKVRLIIEDYDNNNAVIENCSTGFHVKTYKVAPNKRNLMYLVKVKNERGVIDGKNFLTAYVYGNLKIEANYKITEYRDVIRYDRFETPVMTNDFRTWYDVKHHYKIIFKDQLRPYFNEISEVGYFENRYKNRMADAATPN